ncbi:glycosyl hydrolases 38-like [Acidisarcina polymorpha]|uniref:Glycosyl hydrolases 38-like n=1 Tax=Acidisarcina polymorpha TaxID=2211140 RepID=A0A2Z5FYG0_9BACT|nr:glycoside hydrolase family 38 C-terminal domain-containing protein [Acidisarcina polymorpha]AXC11943.1 glycosyl hydrolases 38-like [Acidisarcina polymorpha]
MTQQFRKRLISALLATAAMTAAAAPQSSETPDLSRQPTLYAVGYAHLDTEWRWEYPQVIDEYLRKTMEDNFRLLDKYPHYVFNFSGANRYRLMKEYFPEDFARMKQYIAANRWFPAGSSMEEGDVNAPSAEAIIRQVLYGNDWFRAEFGKASEEYMLPDCFGFPASLPTILAHSGVKAFSTQKLVWGSSANAGGQQSIEKTPEGTPFNVGVWVGPDGQSVLAALNPGAYSGSITTDLSKPLAPLPPNPAAADLEKRLGEAQQKLEKSDSETHAYDPKLLQEFLALRDEQSALAAARRGQNEQRYQGDWAQRVLNNGKATGLFADYHYYGTGDIGGAPDEESVKRLEAIVTRGSVAIPPVDAFVIRGEKHPEWPSVQVGEGPVHVISATADQMFRDITPSETAALPRYTGEMELTNHSAGSLTSQAYQKRWIRQEELLADAAEKSSIAASWLGARSYPMERLNAAWTLAMGAHFHDLAAGTATPRAYEFAWNDDVIAMNQFSDVLKSATQGVAASLDTQGDGAAVVVFNPLNIARQDVVEADVDFPGGLPKAVRVTDAEGKLVESQLAGGKVVFVASAPSVGYAVYHVAPATDAPAASKLRVTNTELENEYYLVKLNEEGDVASIVAKQIGDKQGGRELLSAPARLAISYDNPKLWPAWNMDWDQEQAAPKAYVSGPAKIRIVENGPVRVALEVTRETAGSRFVQTIRLSAGDAGKRVEFGNVIDWNTRESNLKATFPLTASNEMATYNWDIGTIQRPTAQPKKFEIPSHQWVDLTDMSGLFGATILTDDKNGSDKPNDRTIRLTLLRTPGIAGGYADQSTQDIGHHEFTYGIAGHAAGWREGQTDWQALRLNAPLIAFQTANHAGPLGRSFSLVKVSNPRIRIMAVKKAEKSDEVVVRLVELDGKPQSDVRVSFAAPIATAREVNGQEQPLGPAQLDSGTLVTSFAAYQPRAFALKLASPASAAGAVRSAPVALKYDLAAASNDSDRSTAGFDGKGNALPAEMLPAKIAFNDVTFALGQAKTGTPDAIAAKGQTIDLPPGDYNRVYFLAASADGDRKATFEAGGNKQQFEVEDWGGFIGQWDDRSWSSGDTSQDNYGEMIGLKRGFIKRADLAWYCSHHHDASGKNVSYAYSYLYGYGMDLPSGAKTLKLPNDPKIRLMAISVANENPGVKPAQPLYDVLPSPNAGAPDFTISAAPRISVSQGRSATTGVLLMPRGSFNGTVKFSASGVPDGVTATFNRDSATGANVMTLTASRAAAPATAEVTIAGTSGNLSHRVAIEVAVTPILSGTVPVDLSSAFNVTGIYKDGSKFDATSSLDGGGYSLSAEALGADPVGDEVVFKLGPANAPDAVSGKTIELPPGNFSSLKVLGIGVEGSQEMQSFAVNYTDGSSSSFTQSLSDWAGGGDLPGESIAARMPYRLAGDGSKDGNPFNLCAYSFALDAAKTVRSLTLPSNRNVLVFAVTLVPAAR